MFQITKLKSVLIAAVFAFFASGCAGTLEGLKEDLGKVSERSGLTSNSSGLVEDAEESEESEESLVTQIQSILKDQGYYNGEVDGQFNAPTEAAIQDFQLDSGLRIDGRATPELLEALQSR